MIRFVDMRTAGIAGVRFGFWDTVRDCMLSFNGTQGWEPLDDLRDDVVESGRVETLDRLTRLSPAWVHISTAEVANLTQAQLFLLYAQQTRTLCSLGTQAESAKTECLRDEMDETWRQLSVETRQLAKFNFPDKSEGVDE